MIVSSLTDFDTKRWVVDWLAVIWKLAFMKGVNEKESKLGSDSRVPCSKYESAIESDEVDAVAIFSSVETLLFVTDVTGNVDDCIGALRSLLVELSLLVDCLDDWLNIELLLILLLLLDEVDAIDDGP